jgi:hypothetical protein
MPIRRLRLTCFITGSKYIYRYRIAGNIRFLSDYFEMEIGYPAGTKP